MPYTDKDLQNIMIFRDDAIITEEVRGMQVNQNGMWQQVEIGDTAAYLKKFGEFQQSVIVFSKIIFGDEIDVQKTVQNMSVSTKNISKFGQDGTIVTEQVECPVCHRKVDQLLPNGFCSKTCSARYKAYRMQSSITASGENALKMIEKIKGVLVLLDMALNFITELPELIRGKAMLPQEYRDYITLRIDYIFIELKKSVNLLMIRKNDLLIQLMKKIRNGVIDSALAKIVAPIQPILQTAITTQTAMNAAMSAVVDMLNVPQSGLKPQSYGWLMTAKSSQYRETAGKMVIEIVPQINLSLALKNRLNNTNIAKIEEIITAALPPIQDFEFFMEPEAFKVRYALSRDNAPKVMKMARLLEELIVYGADTFPRYKRLNLKNVWFVLSILTGWGPTSRGVFGDFIFHGSW